MPKNEVVEWLSSICKWSEQISRHCSHMERRAMEAEYEGHEVVRMFGNMLEDFVPPPRGDWGWALRLGTKKDAPTRPPGRAASVQKSYEFTAFSAEASKCCFMFRPKML